MLAFQLPISRAQISGPPSGFFSAAARDAFSVGSFRRVLGQTAQDYYNKAKRVVADWDALVARVARLANKVDRDRLIDYYGLSEPTNKDKDQYRREVVASGIATAEKYTPIAYEEGFPTHGPNRKDVDHVGDYVKDLGQEVQTSEATYGTLPQPVVITKIVTVPGAGGGGSSILPYVAAGGVAIAALFVMGVVKI